MGWSVVISSKVTKQLRKLPHKIQDIASLLIKEIELKGPYRNNWSHFGDLGKDTFHCHIKRGRPAYVACWVIENKKIKIVEIYYVGTHENAPY